MAISDPWAQRMLFRELVGQWLEKDPKRTKADLADALEIEPESLKQYFSGKTKIPGRNLIQRMAKVLGCAPGELMDGAAPPAGVSKRDWEDADEEARIFAQIMFHKGKNLTPEQRKGVLKMVEAVQGMAPVPAKKR